MFKISGLNKLLMEQVELVTILSLLQAAKDLYNSDNFKYKMYRKLILDAGSEILKLKEEQKMPSFDEMKRKYSKVTTLGEQY